MSACMTRALVCALLGTSMPVFAADAAHDAHTVSAKPDDAAHRDPNAYSDGYTLHSGPYALPGVHPMPMADEQLFWAVSVDRLEYANGDGNSFATYDTTAWIGNSYDRMVFSAEGDVDAGNVIDSQTQLVWSHAISSFWDVQLGASNSNGDVPDRNWLVLGVEGQTPYWIDVEVTTYWGENGRAWLQLQAEYDLSITQQWALQPRMEVDFFGQNDPSIVIGSGLSTVTAGLRLRYEFSSQFAPYVGVEWVGFYGNTADYVRANGDDARETQWVAGVRFWF
ncbi:MAG TPA: copper resistance protein B [Pseudomonadales bacterium]